MHSWIHSRIHSPWSTPSIISPIRPPTIISSDTIPKLSRYHFTLLLQVLVLLRQLLLPFLCFHLFPLLASLCHSYVLFFPHTIIPCFHKLRTVSLHCSADVRPRIFIALERGKSFKNIFPRFGLCWKDKDYAAEDNEGGTGVHIFRGLETADGCNSNFLMPLAVDRHVIIVSDSSY